MEVKRRVTFKTGQSIITEQPIMLINDDSPNSPIPKECDIFNVSTIESITIVKESKDNRSEYISERSAKPAIGFNTSSNIFTPEDIEKLRKALVEAERWQQQISRTIRGI
jgi:hypothetical protein